MIKYGKTAQNAISAMSFLAEAYDGGETRVSSLDIAEARQLPKPIVAKLLVVLSQAGFVSGAPGPNGGYSLAKSPGEITLHEIVGQFEKTDDTIMCPFGPSWCGNKEPCPLHDELVDMQDRLSTFLCGTTLKVFQQTEKK
jgi:Rrf2 family iron-sulfur cluster assembly transcriptional regulator